MSQELDDLLKNFDSISKQAEEDANEEIGDKISSVTKMSKEEVKELFPERGEQKKLIELMRIVKSSNDHNKKLNAIADRAKDFSGVVVKLLDKFV
tara:strand:- start:157 stop:441 length:285 start_codon:yes stop_codon:yes gene_type:complete